MCSCVLNSYTASKRTVGTINAKLQNGAGELYSCNQIVSQMKAGPQHSERSEGFTIGRAT